MSEYGAFTAGAARVGAAVDIGTTTVEASAVDMATGRRLAFARRANPQRAFGADVLSRVDAVADGRADAASLSRMIKRLTAELTSALGVPDGAPSVAVGNTVMMSLFAGVDPSPVGRAPFLPPSLFDVDEGNFYLPPCVSAFVGSDLIADIIAAYAAMMSAAEFGAGAPNSGKGIADGVAAVVETTAAGELDANASNSGKGKEHGDFEGARAGLDADDLQRSAFEGECPELAVLDIGTNGEAAVVKRGRLFAASAAAGPALEGGGISCGMPAMAGAVSSAWIEAGEIRVGTIGGGEPLGVCGSGLFDIVSCLLALGIIDKNGSMKTPSVNVCGICITREDVRAFQLAKAALRAALDCVIDAAGGLSAPLFVTGSFGSALDLRSCVRVGLIPKELTGSAVFFPGGALAGAELMLTSPGARALARRLAGGAVRVTLSGSPEFERRFIDSIGF